MKALTTHTMTADSLWNRYRDNFSRHLIGVARELQTSIMLSLQQQCGHTHLRLGFAPYIALIDGAGPRLSALSEALGISRQACNQAVTQVESAGYVIRTADPRDGRARRVKLTARGRQLRRDGTRVVTELDQKLAQLAGSAAFADASTSMGKIYRQLQLGQLTTANAQPLYTGMGGLLPRLSDHFLQRLMELTIARGHPGLKLSFGQVLTLIGPAGGRIQQMASIQDVSKQAISATASELEELGYLRRQPDPADARQVVLHFSPLGEKLIADSVASVDELEAELAAIVGAKALRRMNATLKTLYHGLCLEQEVFANNNPADIEALARQLNQQLGNEACQALARLLLSPTPKARK